MNSTALAPAVHNLDNSRGYLPEPPSDFYYSLGRQITPCCGYEFGTPDFHSAFQLINDRLKLGLDQIDCKVFSLMLTGLSQANRFGGDPHISPVMGENSAAHTLHLMILATEVFRSAGLLSAEKQTTECLRMRVELTLGLLMHDMGEILGEPSSVAQRATNSDLQELPEIEREIVSVVLIEAYRAVTDPQLGPAAFYAFLRDMRDSAGIGRGKNGATDLDRLERCLKQCRSKQILMPPLSSTYAERFKTYLGHFDTTELKDSRCSTYKTFVGNAGKIIDHIQGLRHHLRFSSKDEQNARLHLTAPTAPPSAPQGHWLQAQVEEMIPLRLISSFRMIGSARYIHQGLHALGQSARTQAEEALGCELRKRLYQGMAEFHSVGRPIVHRKLTAEEPTLAEALRSFAKAVDSQHRAQLLSAIRSLSELMLEEDANTLAHQSDGAAEGPQLREFETRSRLMKLYIEAARIDYKPTCDNPLWLLEEIPEPLRGFDRINLSDYFPTASADVAKQT